MYQLTRLRLLPGQAQHDLHLVLRGSRTSATRPLYSPCTTSRQLHQTTPRPMPPAPPKSKDRGPRSEEDTQTDFGAMDMLARAPPPTTGVDACTDDGFALNSGLRVSDAGVLLCGGEAFRWRPWEVQEQEQDANAGSPPQQQQQRARLRDSKGFFDPGPFAFGAFDLAWPKPDLLILGTGRRVVPLSPAARARISQLGIRVEVQDTRNAAAQFNMLATERGTQDVAAALVPLGFGELRER